MIDEGWEPCMNPAESDDRVNQKPETASRLRDITQPTSERHWGPPCPTQRYTDRGLLVIRRRETYDSLEVNLLALGVELGRHKLEVLGVVLLLVQRWSVASRVEVRHGVERGE